jgi:hypothetical protein
VNAPGAKLTAAIAALDNALNALYKKNMAKIEKVGLIF